MKREKRNAGRPRGDAKVLFNVRLAKPLLASLRDFCKSENISQTSVAEKAFRNFLSIKN